MIIINKHIADEYLSILGLPIRKPDMEYLRELNYNHLTKIPFENISKLYYKKKFNLNFIPDFEKYLEGIKVHHLGGTCYSNNYYFYQLLQYLGFDIILCGADMTNPDVHIISIVKIEGEQFIVDVGNAGPFFEPMPLGLSYDYIINFGIEKYILHPKDSKGFSRLDQYKDNQIVHGYTIKPIARSFSEFNNVIESSFSADATFMNNILIVLFGNHSSRMINNLSLIEVNKDKVQKRKLGNRQELISEIEKTFGISKEITKEAISGISNFEEAWH
ncbi:MAG TPA: arylamine N-acetyltransferase [Ignavibacteriaceae bacterium]|nr:arylamine N-acetyltransferase [Ignavibacteriaceae bacterium]